ncbi:MAG TPA: response regulator [Alphaproteobacteria bacterium]|nr:response regulator [Alphaproteobacteria bacterium]
MLIWTWQLWSLCGTAALALILALIAWRRRYIADLLEASLNATHRGRQVVDRAGNVKFANSAFLRQFGNEPLALNVILARRAFDASARAALERIEHALAERGEARGDVAILAEDGRREILEVFANRLKRFGDHVSWGVDTITTQREIEEYIRSDHEKFADLIENAPVGFYSVDESGRFLFVNSTLSHWLGLDVEIEAQHALRLHDLVWPRPPETIPAFSPFADPSARNGEVTLQGPNGRKLLVYVRQDVVNVQGVDPSGKAGIRTRSIVHDLTREREFERALQASEQYFQRFFEEAPTGIVLLDAERRVEQSNAAFAALFGVAPAIGLGLDQLVHAEDLAGAEAHLRQVAEIGRAALPLTVRLKGPRQSSVLVYASRREDKGQTVGFILHMLDTTEQKRLEVQFAQSQKMQAVGLLAGGIAHDFNNLLTAMIGFCDLLLLRHRAGDQSFADIMQIKQNANRAANLVRQLLAFSRQQTLQPRVLQVTDVLAEVSHLLRRLIGENIELAMVHGRDLQPVRVDQGQLEQVIINLAVNARDAMPNGGKLRIRTENVTTKDPMQRGDEIMPPGRYVMIEITDTGTGIEPEIIDRIFEPFFSTKSVGSGTGLGLSTVYGIVRQTGGFIFVDSAVGEGAIFRIYLPEHHAEAGAAQRLDGKEDAARDLTGIGTILLVEDEDAVRLFSARALRNKGYQVLEARSGEAALEIVGEHLDELDLIISDVVMPRMDGPTMIKEVRSRRADLPVIFISGYAEDAFRRRIDAGEEVNFLLKPFTLKQLAAKVKEVLEVH